MYSSFHYLLYIRILRIDHGGKRCETSRLRGVIGSVGDLTSVGKVVPSLNLLIGSKTSEFDGPRDFQPVVQLIEPSRREHNQTNIGRRDLTKIGIDRCRALGNNPSINDGSGRLGESHSVDGGHRHRPSTEVHVTNNSVTGNTTTTGVDITGRSTGGSRTDGEHLGVIITTEEVTGLIAGVGIHAVLANHLEDQRAETRHHKPSLRHSLPPTARVGEQGVVQVELRNLTIAGCEGCIVDIDNGTLIEVRTLTGSKGLRRCLKPLKEVVDRPVRDRLVQDRIEHILRGDVSSTDSNLERVSREHGRASKRDITLDEPELLVVQNQAGVLPIDEGTRGRMNADDTHLTDFGRQVVGFGNPDCRHQ
uniref:Capsid protein n=1 Tax=Lynx rufus smacovirus 1 TaxID=2592414 RepID=A0A513ZT24_9VIRU